MNPPPGLSAAILYAPTNSKFLDFSQFNPYFHLVKSFFIKLHAVTVFSSLMVRETETCNYFFIVIKHFDFIGVVLSEK